MTASFSPPFRRLCAMNTYLQVSVSRHFTAALLPRTAHFFAGFVHTTRLLLLSCQPAPSVLQRSLFTPLWEGVSLCMCMHVYKERAREGDRAREREREREWEWEREGNEMERMCALYLNCAFLFLTYTEAGPLCLPGYVLYKYMFMPFCTHPEHHYICVSVCVSMLQQRWN